MKYLITISLSISLFAGANALGDPLPDEGLEDLRANLVHQVFGWSTCHAELLVLEGMTKPIPYDEFWGMMESVEFEEFGKADYRKAISDSIRQEVGKGQTRSYDWAALEIWQDRARRRESNSAGLIPRVSVVGDQFQGTYRESMRQADIYPLGPGHGEKICGIDCFRTVVPTKHLEELRFERGNPGQVVTLSDSSANYSNFTVILDPPGFVTTSVTRKGEDIIAETRQYEMQVAPNGVSTPKFHVTAYFNSGQLIRVVAAYTKVIDFDVAIPDRTFELPVAAGTTVVDHTGDGLKVTRVVADVENAFDSDLVSAARRRAVSASLNKTN